MTVITSGGCFEPLRVSERSAEILELSRSTGVRRDSKRTFLIDKSQSAMNVPRRDLAYDLKLPMSRSDLYAFLETSTILPVHIAVIWKETVSRMKSSLLG